MEAQAPPHPPLIERTRYSYAPIEITCIDTHSWEMDPLGPLGFRFDPDELMSLRNDGECVNADRAVPVSWFV